jgi:hypothetical protein
MEGSDRGCLESLRKPLLTVQIYRYAYRYELLLLCFVNTKIGPFLLPTLQF